MQSMAKKVTIVEQVRTAADGLRKMPRTELNEWAASHDVNNRAAWGRYKAALSTIGIDYDNLKAERQEEPTATVTLYTDAKASKDRFGICGPDGEPVWYGRFFDGDSDYNGEQSSGELAAAKKAVWLAHKAAELTGQIIALTLRVDAEWLCWATRTDGRGGKALELGRAANRYGITLTVEHIPGTQNPADKWTVASGYMRWQDADIASKVVLIEKS